MKVSELIRGLGADLVGDGEIEIRGIAYDSRKVKKGDLFCCLKGLRENGHDFVEEALARGAAALLMQRKAQSPEGVTQIRVKDSRKALALLSDRFYDHPSGKVKLIGITGTNGKTTTSYLLKSVYEKAGLKVGLVGTICHWIGKKQIVGERTTPESLDLQRLLSTMVKEGVQVAVLEVSSHGLSLNRVLGIDFDFGVFTNVSRDHLDFHPTVQSYEDAKLRLFTLLASRSVAVVNSDDPLGKRIVRATRAQPVTYGLSPRRDFRAKIESLSMSGTKMSVLWKGRSTLLQTRLLGRGNVYNVLCSFCVALSDGIPRKKVAEGIKSLECVPGRMQLVEQGQPFTVVVDYAHTPAALENLLLSLKELTPGNLISIFGCGGDRDRGKRPMMGGISTRIAHHTILTSDNPRSEDPASIVTDIEGGIEKGTYEVILSRREAIQRALETAGAEDCVLIAGKGHEDHQVIGEEKVPFKDSVVASEILRGLGWKK